MSALLVPPVLSAWSPDTPGVSLGLHKRFVQPIRDAYWRGQWIGEGHPSTERLVSDGDGLLYALDERTCEENP